LRHLIAISCVVAFAWLLTQVAVAENEGPAVPIERAPYHLLVFRNEYLTVLKIDVPPHRNTGFHIHTMDSVSVNIEDADVTDQLPGEKQTPPQRSRRGQATFTAYSKHPPRIHKASNVGETPLHSVSAILNDSQPGRFSPSSRAGISGYTEIMENDRVRGWRLVLEPGQTAGIFTQKAPGLRIVLDGGEIAELVPGQPDRGMNLRVGEFYWQDPGGMRAVRNTGTTRVEFVEFELK
jgi:predicted metal-dependent enzyme (double-stranded beta helix superfamily)